MCVVRVLLGRQSRFESLCLALYRAIVTVVFILTISPPADAADDVPQIDTIPTKEIWAGADVTGDVWLLYSGVTIAPWDKGIFGDGWRLRAAGGYGQFSFTRDASRSFQNAACGGPNQERCNDTGGQSKYLVQHTYSEVLFGCQKQIGELTAKGFVGVSYVDFSTTAPAEIFRLKGADIGVKGALELWLNIGPKGWSSLDLSYETARATAAARWRAGWRIEPQLSIGPELRYDRNAVDQAGRAGAFARYEWPGGEVSIAGGATGPVGESFIRDRSFYATLNVLFQY